MQRVGVVGVAVVALLGRACTTPSPQLVNRQPLRAGVVVGVVAVVARLSPACTYAVAAGRGDAVGEAGVGLVVVAVVASLSLLRLAVAAIGLVGAAVLALQTVVRVAGVGAGVAGLEVFQSATGGQEERQAQETLRRHHQLSSLLRLPHTLDAVRGQ